MKDYNIKHNSYYERECDNSPFSKWDYSSSSYSKKETNPETTKEKEQLILLISAKQTYALVPAIEQEFKVLANRWKRETGLYSTFAQKVNDTYLEIIYEGKKYLPYILKDLQKGGSLYWHTALKIITKYNPVPDNNFNDVQKVKEAWIAWGKRNNLI